MLIHKNYYAMLTLNALMFAIVVLVMCLWLFDVPMSVAFKRILGVVLLVCFILWLVFGSGIHFGAIR